MLSDWLLATDWAFNCSIRGPCQSVSRLFQSAESSFHIRLSVGRIWSAGWIGKVWIHPYDHQPCANYYSPNWAGLFCSLPRVLGCNSPNIPENRPQVGRQAGYHARNESGIPMTADRPEIKVFMIGFYGKWGIDIAILIPLLGCGTIKTNLHLAQGAVVRM